MNDEYMMDLYAIYDVTTGVCSVSKGTKYCVFTAEYRAYDMIDIYERNKEDESTITFVGIFHKLNFVTLAVWREKQIDSILEDKEEENGN